MRGLRLLTTRGPARRVVVLAVLALGLGALAAGVTIGRVAQRLHAAHSALVEADTAVGNGDLEKGRTRLGAARGELIAANSTLHSSPWLSLVGSVPIAKQNLQSLRDTASLALQITDGGLRVLEGARPLQGADGRVDVPFRAGVFPLEAVGAVAAEMETLAFALPGDPRPDVNRLVVGPVASAQRELAATAAEARQRFVSVGRALDVLNEVGGASGPRRLLIAVANAAEMRGSGGMILSYGVLDSDRGKFTLERFGPIDDLLLPSPAPVAVPQDYLSRFGRLQPNLLWRNANLGSDFTFVGPLLEGMYRHRTGLDPAGVLQIDSEGLAAILRVIGPVDVAGIGAVTADNVVALTLNDAYVRFPARASRQGVLGDVAEAVFRKFVAGDYPGVRRLADALAGATAGRHVMLHVADAPTQRSVRHLGAGGAVPTEGDYLQLTVQNFTGNKLDYFVDTSVALTGQRPARRVGRMRAVVDVINTAPRGAVSPQTVFGPFSRDVRAGDYRGLVTLYLPSGVSLAGPLEGVPGRASVFTEGGHGAVSFRVDVPAGERRRAVLDLRFPPPLPGPYEFDLVPSPRVRATAVRLDLLGPRGRIVFSDEVDRSVTLRPR